MSSVAIGFGTAAASCLTAGFGIVAAAWIVATAFSANFHLHAGGPIGPGTIVLGRLYHMRLDAVPFGNPVRPLTSPADELIPTFNGELPRTTVPVAAPADAAPFLSEETPDITNSVPSPTASLFDPSYISKHEIARFSFNLVTPQLAAAASLLSPSFQKSSPPRQPSKVSIWLPDPDSRTAVYDIEARMVYLPNGDKLEAHSGLGYRRDDPRYVHQKNRGPTPPNVYDLKMREASFHGVRAIRLNPVAGSAMFGRDGILAHTYMLGPSGQSFGCVSFKNYNAFLRAFLNSEIDRMVVVPRLGTMVSTAALTRRGSSEQPLDE